MLFEIFEIERCLSLLGEANIFISEDIKFKFSLANIVTVKESHIC